jgi:hypothetical protein
MTTLSTPLRLSISRSRGYLANRLSTWSHSLASRWLPIRTTPKGWRGILDLSVSPRQAPGNRRDFRHSATASAGKLFTQRRLQTLSLPEGYRFEEPASENWPENQLEEASSTLANQAAEPLAALGVTPGAELPQPDPQNTKFSGENPPDEGASPANFQAVSVNPVRPGEESPLANFEAPDDANPAPHPPHGEVRLARSVQTGSAGPGVNKVSPPRWPFRLVSPFSQQKTPAVRYFPPGPLEFRKQRLSQLPETNTALGIRPPSSAPVLSRSHALPAGEEIIRPRLMARAMLGEQLPLTTTPAWMVTLPFEGAGAPLNLFAQPNRPMTGQAKPTAAEGPSAAGADQLTHQPGAQSPGMRVVQRKTLAGIQPQLGQPALSGIQRASSEPAWPLQSPSVETQAHTPHSSPVAQVQPPQVMLTLYPPGRPETETTFPGPESQSYESRLEQEWPLLSVLHRLETQPEQPVEASAVQVLRRMWPAQSALVRQTLQALAAGGAGERLPAAVLGPMQARLGRDLSQVRLHTSPLVQTLGAEAFTSGSQVVFAPGRLNINTGKGLALLGHELTHLGQPLAFKQESSASQVFEDSEERSARQQEESIRSIVEHGWPETHTMELQHVVRPGGPAMSTAGPSASSSFVQRLADENTGSDQQTGSPAAGSAPASSAQAAGAASPSAGVSTGAGGASGPNSNVDALARQVYGILKNRLRAERDRRELYNF